MVPVYISFGDSHRLTKHGRVHATEKRKIQLLPISYRIQRNDKFTLICRLVPCLFGEMLFLFIYKYMKNQKAFFFAVLLTAILASCEGDEPQPTQNTGDCTLTTVTSVTSPGLITTFQYDNVKRPVLILTKYNEQEIYRAELEYKANNKNTEKITWHGKSSETAVRTFELNSQGQMAVSYRTIQTQSGLRYDTIAYQYNADGYLVQFESRVYDYFNSSPNQYIKQILTRNFRIVDGNAVSYGVQIKDIDTFYNNEHIAKSYTVTQEFTNIPNKTNLTNQFTYTPLRGKHSKNLVKKITDPETSTEEYEYEMKPDGYVGTVTRNMSLLRGTTHVNTFNLQYSCQ